MDDVSQPPVPFDEAGRNEVLAELTTRVAPASLRPISIVSPSPLRPLPAPVVAKVDARARTGLEPTGVEHPRRESLQWVVVPVVAGAAAAIALIVGLAISHQLLALVAGLVLAASVVSGVALTAWVHSDPLRIHPAEGKALMNANLWESRQPWVGPIRDAPERGLVALSADLVAQIAASPAWRSSYLDVHRSRLDLPAELDQIDAQARQCATNRAARPSDPANEAAYLVLVDRVAALRRYAQELDVLGTQLAAAAAGVDAELHRGQFAGGPAVGYPTEAVRQMTSELSYLNTSLAEQIASMRAQHPGLSGRD